ncbi:MAG: FAD-dependent oxidoreductase [Desulfofustis sp.]|nr:FAD-dependent oxidoreductase [Desulfofustis sp.]
MLDKRIAIIGSGISGLTCGYHLTKMGAEITLFESEDYIGGHTHTVETNFEGEQAAIDTGFIVFNDRTYPNFIKLMEGIGVDYQPTEMSFSVRNDNLDLEYNGSSLNGLFAQRTNLLRPQFYRMLFDITRFNKQVRTIAQSDGETTIGEYLQRSNYSPLFKDTYLLPMIAAIWSMGTDDCLDFPLHFFVRFFENHGLLDLANRPQWYTIKGGSSSYVEPLTSGFKQHIRLNSKVTGVVRTEAGIVVRVGNENHQFDEVVFACHGDQALSLLEQPSEDERNVLSHFVFSDNRVVLHTDVTHLPRREGAWASWNYRITERGATESTLTYNMNILQRLQKKHTYMVTLNQDVDPHQTIAEFRYRHPLYTVSMIEAQKQWRKISGVNRMHYCGAYWHNGFHEDGVRSGLRVCSMMEGK